MWRIKPSVPVIFCWLTASVLGGIQAFSARHDMNPDGINYLDLSDAFLRGDWEGAVNGTWSPLYPLLLSAARSIVSPSPYWEFATAHAAGFAIYLFALASFHFFLCQWLQDVRGGQGKDENVSVSQQTWIVLGYALFIWTSLNLITLSRLVTDMCLALFVYLSTALLLKIRSGSSSWWTFALLGFSLGMGYLAKANMFLLALVYLLAVGFAIRTGRTLFPRVMVALLCFCIVSGPFVVSLSRQKGRLTFSDVGKLAYAWHVNEVTPLVHWQGEPAGSGIPRHPTRRIRENPAVYEFATPVAGTFPPGFDPSYWYEGVEIDFHMARQLRAVARSLNTYYQLFLEQGGLFAGWLILLLAGWRGRETLDRMVRQWPLLMPALAALGMFLFVGHFEFRHCAPWLVLMWLGLFGACAGSYNSGLQRLLASVISVTVLLMAMSVCHSTALHIARGLGPIIARERSPHPQWEVAGALHQMGIRPGQQVAYLRSSNRVDWARLARLKIIAEIPPGDVNLFWIAGEHEKSEILEALYSTGARAIIAETPPGHDSSPAGWQRVGDTEYYVKIPNRQPRKSRIAWTTNSCSAAVRVL